MARKVVGPTGSRRRRWLVLLCLGVTAGLAVIFVPSALAVHEFAMQLDGDVSTQAYTVIDNTKQIYDWGGNIAGDSSTQADPNTNGIFNVTDTGTAPTGTEAVTPNSAVVGSGEPFAAASFVRDFRSGSGCTLDSLSLTACTSDTSTYATGSKDTLGIGNGGWQCNKDNNVNSKIDIMNAYSASYFTGGNGTGDHIIYFGMEKNKNNGTNDVGVWLLQGTASCSASTGSVNFTGQHHNKDVLVVSEFTQGGGVSSIKAFEWAAASSGALSGDGGCIDSNDNPDPKNGGCNGLPIFTSNTDSKLAGAGDALSATTNANCTNTALACGKLWNKKVATPWLTWDATLGVGRNQIVSPDFFEGGIDLTQVFGAAGQSAPSCFNTVVPDTRSSASITATLFDFVTEQLGECKTTLTTQENTAASSSIGTGTVSSGTDTANLTLTGSQNWSGTLNWYLCGPLTTIPATGPKCDSTKGLLVTSRSVNQSSSGSDFVSGTATITEVGQYCWTAHFAPDQTSIDAGISGADDTGANECFTVTPVTPTVGTASVRPQELLSPTVYGGLADLNGDGSGTTDPTADNSNAFYGDTAIIGGKLDCNNWTSTNDGTAGDGVINSNDNCTLLGYDGSATGVTINVVAGSFQVPDGTVLPGIFPDPTTPTDSSIVDAKFAWSSLYGKVDSNGNGSIGGTDCSFGIIGSANILGNDASCGAPYTSNPDALNGMVDLNNDGKITSADTCTTGCFLGHQVSSGFVVSGPVDFGQPIYDQAFLTGTATQKATNGIDLNYPSIICNGDSGATAGTNVCSAAGTSNGSATGGKITFTLRGPGTPATACAAAPTSNSTTTGDTNPQDVSPISLGVDGTYGPVHYTPGSPGTYYWQAQYFVATGDANNNNSALHDANCDVSGETVVVRQIPTEIATGPFTYPQDSATITSSVAGNLLPAGGTVVFKLFDSLTNCQNGGSVTTLNTGGLVYIETKSNVVPSGGAHQVTGINTNNTSFKIDSSKNGTYYWRVTYATGDTAHTSRQSACTESTAVTQTDDSGPGTLFTP